MTTSEFAYDVFLSHSAKDKSVVRPIAERLMRDGLRVWYDEWEIRVGDSIPAQIEHGLESSRVLLLCISAHAFGSEWAQLESGTFRFRDPLNLERRFIPVRLDDSPIRGSLGQFLYVDWRGPDRDSAYEKLLAACQPPEDGRVQRVPRVQRLLRGASRDEVVSAELHGVIAYAFTREGDIAFYGGKDNEVVVMGVRSARCISRFVGHTKRISALTLSADQQRLLSASEDNSVRVWDVASGQCIRVYTQHTDMVMGAVWTADQRQVVSCSFDCTLQVWDPQTGECLRVLEGHESAVGTVALSPDQRYALSGSSDCTLRLWDLVTGESLHEFQGHSNDIWKVCWSADQMHALSCASDGTIRLWDLEHRRCLRVFEGHTAQVYDITWTDDGSWAVSCGEDGSLRMWHIQTGRSVIRRSASRPLRAVAWISGKSRVVYGDYEGSVKVWDLSTHMKKLPPVRYRNSASTPDQVQYTNAKVLLVGESGAGKTGLSKRLSGAEWEPSDSTVGVWATQWKLPVSPTQGIEREIWLWDFGGQADQRLVHQLYMNETALVILVFDGQKDDLFDTLGQWDRDISRASQNGCVKLLVAGRVDAGGLRASSRIKLEKFAKEHGFVGYFETSAKTGEGCAELKQAILTGIRWEDIPWRSSPLLFKHLRDEIVRLKDSGRVLMRFNELRETLQLRGSHQSEKFSDDELRAVITLLAGPGVLWELKFGSWVLLQPESINAYAQAVIQTLRGDKFERGCLLEERVLKGALTYTSSSARLEADEERIVLLAMHQILIERGLCLREHTENGTLLIFPSFYRRERPELVGHPAVLVSYRFSGFLDEIYATLVVRLHHTRPFEQDELWRYAADFKTLTGRQLGIKMTRRGNGMGELDVYFDPFIPLEEKIIFTRYVHEHLMRSANAVVRLRHYVCQHCGTPVGNREVAMRKLQEGKQDIPCISCDDPEKRIPLWDELEALFASKEVKRRVTELEKQSTIVLDNESKERALVGEIVSTVALAGQISREFSVSDHGIDMEIEFKSDTGEATGRKVYLQLKSGDSYLTKRKSDGAEIFKISKARHAEYWRNQAFPVMLVIRDSDGSVRWMEIRDHLRRVSEGGTKRVSQIKFRGERFDVMSVRGWRDVVLSAEVPRA